MYRYIRIDMTVGETSGLGSRVQAKQHVVGKYSMKNECCVSRSRRHGKSRMNSKANVFVAERWRIEWEYDGVAEIFGGGRGLWRRLSPHADAIVDAKL